jgi:hypothetical protein
MLVQLQKGACSGPQIRLKQREAHYRHYCSPSLSHKGIEGLLLNAEGKPHRVRNGGAFQAISSLRLCLSDVGNEESARKIVIRMESLAS